MVAAIGALSPRRNLVESFAAASESGSDYVQSESEHSVVGSQEDENTRESCEAVLGAEVGTLKVSRHDNDIFNSPVSCI